MRKLAKAAKRLEEGEIVDIRLDSNDEVGIISSLFASMSKVIASREAQISQRNVDLLRVLDNVAEGLMTVRKDGSLSEERSRAIDDWFGRPATGVDLFDYFERVDQATGDVLRLGWTALNDDFMPVEVVLDQMQVRFPGTAGVPSSSIFADLAGASGRPGARSSCCWSCATSPPRSSADARRWRSGRPLRVFRSILVDPAGFRDFLSSGTLPWSRPIEQDQGADRDVVAPEARYSHPEGGHRALRAREHRRHLSSHRVADAGSRSPT